MRKEVNFNLDVPEHLQYKDTYDIYPESRDKWLEELYEEAKTYYPAKVLYINYVSTNSTPELLEKVRDVISMYNNDREYDDYWDTH